MSQVSPQQRLTGLTLDQRWLALSFDLRLSSLYHTERKRFFNRLHTCLAAMSAVFGSATVAALLIDDMPQGKHLAIAFSFVVAVGAALDSAIGFARRANDYGDLARRFIDLERAFIAAEASEEAYARLLADRRAIEADEPPAIRALVKRCHRELAQHDGYQDGENGMPAALGFWRRHFAQVLPFR